MHAASNCDAVHTVEDCSVLFVDGGSVGRPVMTRQSIADTVSILMIAMLVALILVMVSVGLNGSF